jgi:hypothetical protein
LDCLIGEYSKEEKSYREDTMATMRGKTSKTVALPGFFKIKRSGGSGGNEVATLLWQPWILFAEIYLTQNKLFTVHLVPPWP